MRQIGQRGLKRMTTVAALLLAASMPGCGSSSNVEVTGTVTLDGRPISDGTISFLPEGGDARLVGWGPIRDGNYAIGGESALASGKHRVEIRAMEPLNPAAAVDPTLPVAAKELVPARYNTRSELTADLTAGGNVVNFDLKSK